jgi:hypothetical protein
MTEDETVQAVETPAPDANVAPDAETPETPPAESSPAVEESDKDSKSRDRFQRRIDKLTYDYRETERERDYLRNEVERLRTSTPKQDPAPSTARKTLADFEFDESKYQDYLFEQATTRATEAAEKRLQAARDREAAERRASAFTERESKFAKTTEDYYEVTRDSRVPFTKEMAEVVAESEDGPAIAYHLGKNLALAESIARMSPLAQARELGRLEVQLAFERKQAAEAKKRVSQAPPPPPKIEATDAAQRVSTTSPESDRLSDEEWVKAERARLNRKANRK